MLNNSQIDTDCCSLPLQIPVLKVYSLLPLMPASLFCLCLLVEEQSFTGRVGLHRIHRTHIQHIPQIFTAPFVNPGLTLYAAATAVHCGRQTRKADQFKVTFYSWIWLSS